MPIPSFSNPPGASISAANIWSQNQTFSGTNNTAPSQTLTGSSSILTQGLGDSRYGAFYSLIQPTDLSCYSHTTPTTSSTQITLPSGSYQFWGYMWATSISTSAGINANLALVSGSNPVAGIWNGPVLETVNNSNPYDSNTQSNLGISGIVYPANSNFYFAAIGSVYSNGTSSGSHCQSQSSGWFQINSSVTIAFQVSQRTSDDLTNPALLRANSAFFFRKFA